MPLAEAMGVAVDKVVVCSTCGNIDTSDPCAICCDPRRDRATLIVVEDVSDLWALGTRAGGQRALPRSRRHALAARWDRPGRPQHRGAASTAWADGDTKELIIAVNATMEGQTTAHYITDQLSDAGGEDLRVTRLAHGVPVGGELDYLDEGTLSAALKSRTAF